MKRRSTCKQCGRSDRDCGRISRSGLCGDCGEANMRQAADALTAKQGPVYHLWKRNTDAAYIEHLKRQLARIEHEARAAERSG